jgi:predicted CXXCH cytochrome family protein
MTSRLTTLAVFLLLFAAICSAQGKSTCLDCHSGLDQPLGIAQEQYGADIHAQKGLTCASCHGGDPTADDPERAMGKAAGFRGHIAKKDVPQLCGKCHSDGAYIRQFNPSVRTDQLAQYATSQHGKRLAAGDTKVAVCTDCHGVHGIRAATDTRSPVHPLNVAKTCSKCHADTTYMAPYKIPTDQFAGYTQSVHHEAMTKRGDLSAPTCTTCHGNHGAAPPGVASVENVCANCHVFQAQLFDKSPHKAAFASAGLPSCVSCHSNHKIVHPTDEMLGAGQDAVCTNCHGAGTNPLLAAAAMRQQIAAMQSAIERSDELLSRAERSGMEVSEARLQQTQARDALTKARVDVHTFATPPVQTEVQGGLKITAATYAAGQKALHERDYRRKGLGVSLILIAFVVAGLRMYIREIEQR